MASSGTESAANRSGLPMKLVLGCVSLILALGVGELALRLFWQNPFARESPDHLLKLRFPHPNTDGWIDRSAFDPAAPRVRLRSDARSYVMPSTVHAKPDLTVAFLGGSTTACNAVREDVRFPAVVGQLLTERGVKTNSLNVARASGTLHDSLNVFLNHVVDDEPDIVVLMHATNDIGVLDQFKGYSTRVGRPVRVADVAKWLTQMASSRSSVVGLIRQSRVTATSGIQRFDHVDVKNDPLEPPVDTTPFERRLRSFVRIAKSFEIEPVLMTQPLASTGNVLTPEWADLGNQDRFNAVIRDVARTEGAMLIDLVQHLSEDVPEWDAPMKYFYDGMHVNDDGSRVYGAHIAEMLYPLALEVVARRTSASVAPTE